MGDEKAVKVKVREMTYFLHFKICLQNVSHLVNKICFKITSICTF